jgi:hypothetical protein
MSRKLKSIGLKSDIFLAEWYFSLNSSVLEQMYEIDAEINYLLILGPNIGKHTATPR